MKRLATSATIGTLIVAAASNTCAQGRSPSAADPWEPANRFGFVVFMALDRAIIRPVAMIYSHVVPSPLRKGIHNMLSNMSEPVVGINDVFQGHFRKAGVTTARFVTNTTLGVGGLFDMASQMGAPHHDNGFDLTLGRYHVKSGPYLFVPIVGPTSVRDLFGYVVDGALDPLHWANYPHRTTIGLSRTLVGGADKRSLNDSSFESLLSDATDPYATLRSVYLQNEQSQIDEGRSPAQQPLPDFDESAPPGAQEPAAPPPETPQTPPTAPQAAPAAPQTPPAPPEAASPPPTTAAAPAPATAPVVAAPATAPATPPNS
ncbi:MAG TPA: VacJ family lipoprotein [Caulobacteraceae bacterium]